MTEELATTWDGLPISPEPPFGVCVVIYRRQQEQVEFLILHRADQGADFEGEWAWTPPSGARFPNEPVDNCAQRELLEELGLTLAVQPTERSADSWAIYSAEASLEDEVVLDAEHDRYAWVSLARAKAECLPEPVGASLQYVAQLLHLV